MRLLIATTALSALLCAACSGDPDAAPRADAGDEPPLPVPEEAGGSVTGMPDGPGPGDVPIAGTPPPPPAPEAGAPLDGALPLLEDNPEAGLVDVPDAPAAGEPTPADAVAVVNAYYAAIAAGDPARAYALWSDGGRSSGQTPEQFAAGFADTRAVIVEPGTPGRVEGAAGSRYVEVPVAVAATRADGSLQRFVGAYVLRRAVADGADDAQRAWRIASAELHEVRP